MTSSSTPLKMAASQVPPTGSSSSGQNVRAKLKCFNYGEGHRMSECKKETKVNKRLLIENNNLHDDSTPLEEDTCFDKAYEEDLEEEFVYGDNGPLLVVHRACRTPRAPEGDGWLRTKIFQSSYTIGGKVCRMIIDFGSCKNVVSEETVIKLGLETQTHPQPYKLS